jgi:hypothetical protein
MLAVNEDNRIMSVILLMYLILLQPFLVLCGRVARAMSPGVYRPMMILAFPQAFYSAFPVYL